MAAKIPMRFRRVAEAFEELVAQRTKCCLEHLPADDLLDRVNSFLERGNDNYEERLNYEKEEYYEFDNPEFSTNNARDLLRGLLSFENDDDDHNVKRMLRAETEQAYGAAGNGFSPDFKRRLVNQLRERGFDAGLCKSRWEKMGQTPSGNYEYIDVNIGGTRYIIEVFLAGEFEIARPTKTYTSLLGVLPFIFVGKIEELKQIVKIMCDGIKLSLKDRKMHVPPWRGRGYVQAKWSSSYNRTINEILDKNSRDSDDQVSARKRAAVAVGFLPLPMTRSFNCGENFVTKVGLRVGHLTMVINGTK